METNDAEAKRYFQMRMQDIRDAMNHAEKQEELWNNCLAIDATISINVQLSTGGPGDGFEIICAASNGEPLYGNHYFMNWGFRREFSLSADELADVCSAYAIEDGRQYLNRN